MTIALLLVFNLSGCIYAGQSETPTTAHITVEVVHADGSTVSFNYDTDEEYLGTVLVEEGLVEGEDSEYGLYITTVDGESAVWETDGAYWAFYIGEDYALTGVDSTPVTDGEVYSLVYTVG